MNLRANQSLERYLQEIGEVPLLTCGRRNRIGKADSQGGAEAANALWKL